MRKNSFDHKRIRKNSMDSVDSCSHSVDSYNEKIIPIKKPRRVREQPLEIKDPSPKPENFKYLLIFNKTKN